MPLCAKATVQDAVGSTQQTGDLISGQVAALQSTVRTMVEDVGSMMGRLNAEVAAIDQSASALNNAGSQSLDALEERRAAMDALAQSFTARADEIDGRMRTFAQTIADSVNAAERSLLDTRAQMENLLTNSGEQVNEALVASANNVSQRLADLRAAAEAER